MLQLGGIDARNLGNLLDRFPFADRGHSLKFYIGTGRVHGSLSAALTLRSQFDGGDRIHEPHISTYLSHIRADTWLPTPAAPERCVAHAFSLRLRRQF